MRLLIFMLTLLFLVRCKKAEEEFQNYLTMEIDGVAVACDSYIQASEDPGHPTQLLSISGNWKSSPLEVGAIAIELYGYDNTPGEKQLLSPSGITIWLTHKDGRGGEDTDRYYARESDAKLNIMEVNKKYIRGTFACTSTTMQSNGTVVKKSFTNGSFYINRG